MRSELERVEEDLITRLLADGWGIRSAALAYLPVGGGAYHWIARTADGRRWFVTCDDLDIKPWLGADRDSVFDGLLAAYAGAIELRARGLSFVAAPIASFSGAPAERVDDRHSVSVFEYVGGGAGTWGRPVGPLDDLVTMLARLHRATPAARGLVRRRLEVPARDRFESALDDLGRRWKGGPLADHARRADRDGTVVSAYRELTGVTLSSETLAAHRLLWALSDVAAFTAQLRDEHRADALRDVEPTPLAEPAAVTT